MYDGEVTLDFDEKKHTYSVTDRALDPNASNVEPVMVPSVTGITGIVDKSGPLMWWAVSQCCQYLEDNLMQSGGVLDLTDEVKRADFLHNANRAHLAASRTATDIGTMAHQWIEDYFAGKNPEPPTNKQLKSTIDSFLTWANTYNVEPVETEFKIYSREHGYAGTCDFEGYINGEYCIADWKTGKAVYPEHQLQTMAYLLAREEETGQSYDARWVVVLPKDGGEVIAKRFGDSDVVADSTGFWGALDLWRFLKEKKR
jgi:hypothetical protein